eukprot:752783-Hanusia_phi.AAC.1
MQDSAVLGMMLSPSYSLILTTCRIPVASTPTLSCCSSLSLKAFLLAPSIHPSLVSEIFSSIPAHWNPAPAPPAPAPAPAWPS